MTRGLMRNGKVANKFFFFFKVPCDQLDKVVVEGDTSTSIKDGGVAVAIEVCGHNLQERERENRAINHQDFSV